MTKYINLSISFALTSILTSVTMSAQTFNIQNDWQLVGAVENINITDFDEKCVDFIWKYSPTDVANPWKIHIANGKTYSSTSNYGNLTTLTAGEGFWIKGNNSCTINSQTVVNTKFTQEWLDQVTFYEIQNEMDGHTVPYFIITHQFKDGKWLFNDDGSAPVNPTKQEGLYTINSNGELAIDDTVDNLKFKMKITAVYSDYTEITVNGVDFSGTVNFYTNKAKAEAAKEAMILNEVATTKKFTEDYIAGKTLYAVYEGEAGYETLTIPSTKSNFTNENQTPLQILSGFGTNGSNFFRIVDGKLYQYTVVNGHYNDGINIFTIVSIDNEKITTMSQTPMGTYNVKLYFIQPQS